MKKLAYITGIAICIVGCVVAKPPPAHADYFQYPCPYPFVGSGADVQVLAHGGGQYCDGPTEINGTHFHCMAGGGGIGGGAIGLAPIPGLPLTGGGFGGSGFGMNLEDCHYVCPDEWLPPQRFPNPPAAWVKPLVVQNVNNVCIAANSADGKDHMGPNGFDSAPVPPADLDPDKPGVQLTPPAGPQVAKTNPADEGSPVQPGSPVPLP
jgi:hypothetical protein